MRMKNTGHGEGGVVKKSIGGREDGTEAVDTDAVRVNVMEGMHDGQSMAEKEVGQFVCISLLLSKVSYHFLHSPSMNGVKGASRLFFFWLSLDEVSHGGWGEWRYVRDYKAKRDDHWFALDLGSAGRRMDRSKDQAEVAATSSEGGQQKRKCRDGR